MGEYHKWQVVIDHSQHNCARCVIHAYVLSRKFIHMGSITIISMVACLCFSIRERINDTGYATTRHIAVAITDSHMERKKIFAY